MDLTHNGITEYAHTLGINDIGFADAEHAIPDTDGQSVFPGNLLPGATCIIVLFSRYLPADAPPADHMAISSYYIASHAAYKAAKKLTEQLIISGAKALHVSTISAQQAALRVGGFLGDNGFYYHPQFGSFVCIQTIITDAVGSLPKADSPSKCTHCGACMAACPSRAAADINRCLRKHINTLIPECLRGDVYQLIGCEKCQSACPLNSNEKSPPLAYPVGELLNGQHTAELKALAGPNYVRQRRIISQAVLYAAATNARQHIGRIRTLADTAEEPVISHARWALAHLKKGSPHDT